MALYGAVWALVEARGGKDCFRTADWPEEAGHCMTSPWTGAQKCSTARFLIGAGSWASLQLSRKQRLSNSESAIEILFSTVRALEIFTSCRSTFVAHQMAVAAAIKWRRAGDAPTAHAAQKGSIPMWL